MQRHLLAASQSPPRQPALSNFQLALLAMLLRFLAAAHRASLSIQGAPDKCLPAILMLNVYLLAIFTCEQRHVCEGAEGLCSASCWQAKASPDSRCFANFSSILLDMLLWQQHQEQASQLREGLMIARLQHSCSYCHPRDKQRHGSSVQCPANMLVCCMHAQASSFLVYIAIHKSALT